MTATVMEQTVGNPCQAPLRAIVCFAPARSVQERSLSLVRAYRVADHANEPRPGVHGQ